MKIKDNYELEIAHKLELCDMKYHVTQKALECVSKHAQKLQKEFGSKLSYKDRDIFNEALLEMIEDISKIAKEE